MKVFVKVAGVLAGASLALGGLTLAVAPAASAACGGYGEAPCATFTLSFDAAGGACSPSSVSGLEGSTVFGLTASQCTRSGFTLSAWSSSGQTFAPGFPAVLSGNRGFTAVWSANATPTASPSASASASASPSESATGSPTASPTPTVSVPAGQTNPDTQQRPAPGVVVVSQVVADRTDVTEETSRATRRVAERDATELDRGSVFQAGAELPGNRASYNVRLQTPSGEFVDFGTLRSDRRGVLTTPAIRYTVAGTYFWVFERSATSRFLAIVVS